jgi:hypothetical protein
MSELGLRKERNGTGLAHRSATQSSLGVVATVERSLSSLAMGDMTAEVMDTMSAVGGTCSGC